MSRPEWEEWWPKAVPSRQIRFTGFDVEGGNGYEILAFLHDKGMLAVRDRPDNPEHILLDTAQRADARLRPGDWLVDGVADNGTDIYPRQDKVNSAKYEKRMWTP